jgi:hypothetical protein
MDQKLPADVRVAVLPEGVRYVLPRRELGQGRKVGWVVLVVGLVITGFMVFWMVGPLIAGIRMLLDGELFGWVLIGFSLLGTMGLVVGLGILCAGVAIVTNATHSEVELRHGKLRAVERFGWARWTRKRRIEDVQKLELGPPLTGSDFADKRRRKRSDDVAIPIGDQMPEDLATIRAYGAGIKPLIVAPGYPLDMLRALAGALSERMSTSGKARLFDGDREVAVVERPDKTPAEREALAETEEDKLGAMRPPDAKSILEEHEDGLTITVPPLGIWKGSKGLAVFAVMWNGFIAFFIVMLTLFELGLIENDGDNPGWLGFLFMIPFVAVGVGTALAAVNMGRRRAILDVVGRTLLVSRQSIFGTKQREWSANQLEKIIRGSSGMEVNDVPVMELQIHPREGKKYGMLSQLDDMEIAWIARTLRRALGLHKTH